MRIRFLKLVAGLYLLLMAQFVSADNLGIYAGIGNWSQDFSGDIFFGTAKEFDITGDSGNSFYVALEHPVPVLPNIKIAKTDINDSGRGTYTHPTEGLVEVDTTIDLSHTDFTLYYEIIDVGINVDLGLTARKFDGKFSQTTVVGGLPLLVTDITATIPLLYVSIRGDLPLTGFYLGADINTLSYSGNGFVDYTAKIGWTTDSWILPEIGIEVGLRSFSVKADTKELDLELDFETKGVFVNIVAHF